jgi:MFS family permease
VAAYQDKDVRPLYAVSFLTMLGFGFFTAFTAIFLSDRFSFPEKDIGIYFGIVGLWIVFAQLFVVRVLSNKYEGKKLLLWSLPVLAGVILLHPFIKSTYLLYTALPFIAISFGLFNANLPALISKTAPSDKQGTTLGINGSLQALSQAIAPLAAGVFSGLLGLTTSFFIGGGLVLAAFFVIKRIR